ncbi:TIGR03986 family CRISPR-associated RAMP protein [Desulforamulus putei]|uniref:TIGR03986 family type III CRISPR-associated RAMP protein n=1 Tax=Desulforamulus putei TaxID=74701 RepID=UPI002FDE3D6E
MPRGKIINYSPGKNRGRLKDNLTGAMLDFKLINVDRSSRAFLSAGREVEYDLSPDGRVCRVRVVDPYVKKEQPESAGATDRGGREKGKPEIALPEAGPVFSVCGGEMEGMLSEEKAMEYLKRAGLGDILAGQAQSAGTQDGNQFLNPYNFVRYLDQPAEAAGGPHLFWRCQPPPHDRFTGLSGRITCRLVNITPLFISDSHGIEEDGQNDGHKKYRFFQIDGRKLIPGSSLRGMVRSVYEAATNSCFAVFDDRRLSYRNNRYSAWLVPARIEGSREEGFKLKLLPGRENMIIYPDPRRYLNENYPKSKTQYAGWLYSFWPLEPSKTLKQKNDEFVHSRRGKTPPALPEDTGHGSECWAILKKRRHSHPNITFYDVVEIEAPDNEQAIKEKYNELKMGKGDFILTKGYLCKNNQNIESKHSERFFFDNSGQNSGQEINLPLEKVKEFEKLIAEYADRHCERIKKLQDPQKPLESKKEGEGKHAAYSRFIVKGCSKGYKVQDGELVYALLAGSADSPDVVFLAPVLVPRVFHEKSMRELLPKYLHKCKKIEVLCPACRLFGWVGGNDKDRPNEGHPADSAVAFAGRLSFSSGKMIYDSGEEGEITLAILSSPKPTATSFYLLNRQSKKPSGDLKYAEEAVLRGRKFYLHHGAGPSRHPDGYEYERPEGKKDNQNRTVRNAVKPGAVFEFTVDFESLAPAELGALLWSLQLEEGMYHRLGYARPLGFGSVKVIVEKVEVFDLKKKYLSLTAYEQYALALDRKQINEKIDRFKSEMKDLYGREFGELENIKDLQKILSTPPLPNIHYPRLERISDPKGENFRWFINKGKQKQPLPLAGEDRGLCY